MSALSTKPRSKDLLEQMSPDMYRAAYERGMSLSAWLETEDPSAGYNDNLDAFGRLLKVAGIRVKSVPGAGVYADELSVFEKSEQVRALMPEFVSRVWKRASGNISGVRTPGSLYTSNDNIVGSGNNPWFDTAVPRSDQITPAIPLREIVAITTPINSDAYRAFYLTADTDEQRMVRVAEGAEVPRAKLIGGDRMIRLRKFGRALEISYEQLRRMRIDIVAFHLARLAVQAETDKVAAALDVIVNGDGNSGTAATNYNASTLDSASTGGALTLKAWLAFKMKFTAPYQLTTVLGREGPVLTLMLVDSGTDKVPLATFGSGMGLGGFRTINPSLATGVGVGWIADAPSNVLVGFDNRLAIEHVVEVGSNITEVDKWITRQTEVIVVTEVEGFAVFDQNAAKTLTLA